MSKVYARRVSIAAGSAAALFGTLVLSGQSAQAAPPGPPSAATARTYLAQIKQQPEGPQDGYSRAKFPHWIDQGKSCNTREVVLKRDGKNVQQDGSCAAVSGTWVSPYDGATWTKASDLDIDHVVPLSEAWKSGAAKWTTARRQALANDLTHSQLIAVTDNVNQEKGDKDPAKWLPPKASYRCQYARMWVWVKHEYGMTADSAEKAALKKILDGC
ncbi:MULTISPECIES: HNH endonuclease family protein [Streptomyces]|uniref:HNH endonuclease family protein n=1 Tax=Streptomyces bugieae TaxID=3098223 RepID=A0ABU7NSK7_9ACTN|nr:HNH endonuclease family protein [Streptomyces nigrescens]MEE4421868.1 HNH endonuclease family protein [Streptomyces sp. DSM 41528]